MAKLSLGKAFGDTNRKTSKRMLQKYGADGAIATQSIAAPGLKPSNSIVDTYQQVERMNVPSVQLGKFANAALGFDNSADLQNLANSLSSFNQNLQATASTLAKRKKQVDEEAKNFAQSLALQSTGSENTPIEILQNARQGFVNVIESESSSIDEKEAATKSLNYIDSRNKILIPHLESQNRIISIKTNAASLSSKAKGATVLLPDGTEVPLNTLSPDNPLYLDWRRKTVYGDNEGRIIPLSSKESKEVSPTVLAAYANDVSRQETAVIQHNKDLYEKESLVHVDGLAQIAIKKTDPDEVVKQLNQILDDSRYMQLYRTKEDREKFIDKLINQWKNALLIEGQNTGVFLEADEAFEPWLKLMTGKKTDRTIIDNDKNSPTFGQEIINDKLLWHKSFKEAWEANTKYKYTQELNNARNQQKTTETQKGNNLIDAMFTEEILPKLKEIDKLASSTDGGFASDKIQTELLKIKQMYEEAKNEIVSNVPIRYQEDVLSYANKKIITSDGYLFGPERKLLETQLNKEFSQVFINKQKAIAFRDKVNKLISTGAIDADVGLNFINRTNNVVSEVAKPNQEFAADIIKRNLDRFASSKGTGYFYESDSPGQSAFILEEMLELSQAEQKMTDGANKIIEEGLKNNKNTQVINAELTKFFQDTDFGLVSKYQTKNLDGTIPKAFDSIDDYKNRFIGTNQNGKIDGREAIQLEAMYKSDVPMFSEDTIDALLNEWNTNGRKGVNKDLKKMFRSLKKSIGITPYDFFQNQLQKHGKILDQNQINDIDKFNKQYAKLNLNTSKPLSFIQKVALTPVDILLGGQALQAGELNSNPYNFVPKPGTQTVGNMLNIALTSEFTTDEAVIMAAIGMAESSGRPHAHNTKGDDNSYGLWQINMLDRPGFMMGEERRGQFGLDSNEQLFDPLINGKAAKYIYDMQGFEAWTVYKTGAYLKYLPAAQEALKSLSE